MFKNGKYYRPDEIAEILSVDRSTVYRMIKNPEHPLPAIRIGGNGPLRVKGDDLNGWLSKMAVNPDEI